MISETKEAEEITEKTYSGVGEADDVTDRYTPGRADVAIGIAEKYQGLEYTEEEEKKVVLKIDLHLMPFLIISYFLQFLDKGALSQSSVFELTDSIKLVGQEYSWAGSIFYFGYLAGQPLASYMCQRFSISKFVGGSLIMWAVVLICTVACKDFSGLAAIRFFLGLCEASVSPSWVLLTGSWYLQSEQSVRVSYWYCGNALGVLLGGLIAYGLGHIESSLPPWKWFYIIYGILTFFWGILVFFMLPDSIPNARFLNEKEKYIAVERIRKNKTGVKNQVFKWDQAKETLLDVQIWIIALIEFAGCLPASGISVFGSLIIKSFGFTSFQTVLMNMPAGAIQAFFLLGTGFLLKYYPNCACWVQSIVMIPCLIGTCIVKYIPNTTARRRGGKLVAFWIQYANTGSDVALLTLMTRNLSGYTRRVTANSMVFIAYCVGMIAGPQFFLTSQAPGYAMGFRMMIVCWVIMMALPLVLLAYYKYENRRRDKLEGLNGQEGVIDVKDEDFLDLTDKQQHGFRYSL